jgi:hypothetical protein
LKLSRERATDRILAQVATVDKDAARLAASTFLLLECPIELVLRQQYFSEADLFEVTYWVQPVYVLCSSQDQKLFHRLMNWPIRLFL